MCKKDWWTQINPSQPCAIWRIQIYIWCISHWLFPFQTETRVGWCEGLVKGIHFDLHWIIEWSYAWLQEHLVFNWELFDGIHIFGFGKIITEYWVESADIVSKILEIWQRTALLFSYQYSLCLGKSFSLNPEICHAMFL